MPKGWNMGLQKETSGGGSLWDRVACARPRICRIMVERRRRREERAM